MAIAGEFNLKRVVVRDRARATVHALPWAPATTATQDARGTLERGNGHGIVTSRLRMCKRYEAKPRFPQPEPGNRHVLKGNHKTRSLLRIDKLELAPDFPVIPVMSIVPLAAVSSVRMLLVHQSASKESV